MITGASSGIGRGLAESAAKRGAIVGLIARRASVLDEVINEIESNGGKALAVAADVQDAEGLRTAAERLANEFGPIDTLIACAGVATTTHASKLEPSEVANVIQVNVLGAANSVAAVLPEMISRRSGHLVAISSSGRISRSAKVGCVLRE